METKLSIYIDQEPDGMWLLHGDAEKAYKLSHSAFIEGNWLAELPVAKNDKIELIVELAHTVSALKSPAQRFTTDQWNNFYSMCNKVKECKIIPLAWPERITPNARRFAYGCPKKADNASGVHDIIAMKAYHQARPHMGLMRLNGRVDTIHPVIRAAVEKHRAEMNYHLLRLKNHGYPDDRPQVIQAYQILTEMLPKFSEIQISMLDIEESKRKPGTINESGWNRYKAVTLLMMTHNLDGTVRVDNMGRPIGHTYLKALISNSPYRCRKSGVHRANIMNNARPTFIAKALEISGKSKMNNLITPDCIDKFIQARNDFDREWLRLAKMFRDHGDLT
jgi:hypothetical protein